MSSGASAVLAVDITALAKLVARAIEVFGSSERAVRWLETTNAKLGGATPLQVFQASGADGVEEELVAIEHGIVA